MLKNVVSPSCNAINPPAKLGTGVPSDAAPQVQKAARQMLFRPHDSFSLSMAFVGVAEEYKGMVICNAR